MNACRTLFSRAVRVSCTALLGVAAGAALAAPASIANVPLAFQGSSPAKPNLMFILDDSGSMDRGYMPDGLSNSNGRCFGYSGYNRIFFDPNSNYPAPPDGNGGSKGNQTWPNAKDNGFSSTSSTTNLSDTENLSTSSTTISTATSTCNTGQSGCSGSTTTDGSTGIQTRVTISSCNNQGNNCTKTTTVSSRYYWATLKAGVSNTCNDANFDVVYDPATLTAAQKQNYANWWAYYRTRLLMVKSAAGRVFDSVDATRFRVGYSTIHETSYSDSNDFLNIRDFDTQKTTFFSKLYGQGADSGTSLRPALEKAGRYYAGVQMNGSALPSGTDPVQYSCQRNYTILSTDGYWNNYDGDEDAFRSSYLPKKLNGTDLGNTDGTPAARPILDDGKTQGSNWVTGGAGVSNSLADIAMYFYATDLRTGNCTINGQDVCTNNLTPLESDTANHQHMTTYTVGLGVAGTLTYQSNYDDPNLTSGDFYAIRSGSKPWPDPKTSQPTTGEGPERIDDLWHAAVNGRGRYYSAASADDLVTGLTDTLDKIQSATGIGAAAATSALQPVSGDNYVFLATYTTQLWEGNLKAMTIDPASGVVNTTPQWEAKSTLLSQASTASDSRTIYFFRTNGGNNLSTFTYTDLSSAGYASYFDNLCQSLPPRQPLTQCAALAAAGGSPLSDANLGTNVVNYLRGQTGKEDVLTNVATSRLFRGRTTPLGDVINSAPAYVKKPPFQYTDADYVTFAANQASRTAVVYLAANDGMLHAFNATTGAELWAYVPTMVLPNLYRLADSNYASNHHYFVDGTPVIADVYDGSNWHTILVGGLNAGGRGYYALDVTDPAAPKALWEVSSANEPNLGLTFGNPIITKNKAGTWVVAFASGYNNVTPGDGNGYLFVRNAITGAAVSTIPTFTTGTTPAGTTTTPSNLAKIAAWLDTTTNNTAARVYGGDMLGNFWRFDFDDNIAPSGNEAFLLARAEGLSGTGQPITTRPQVFTIAGVASSKFVAFGTGRLLGTNDVTDTTLQSIYVFKDDLSTTGLGVLRSNSGMVQQTLSETTINSETKRIVATPQAIDWTTKNGWYVDLNLSSGERVNVDTALDGGSLVVAGNIPSGTVCAPGGSSWRYEFGLSGGTVLQSDTTDAMLSGINLIKVASGATMSISWTVRGVPITKTLSGGNPPPASTSLRRTSWRELME